MVDSNARALSATARRGQITVLCAILFPVVLAAAAFAIDLGHVSYTRCKLVSAAQGGAVAAAEQLPNSSVARTEAQLVSKLNYANGAAGDVVVPQDVEFGDWNPNAREFTVVADPDKANAVRVTARLSEATGNPLALFMGHIMGRDTADVSATAIASRQLFGHGSACVHVTSTKDLSNVVLEFADGATQKFDGLNEPTGVFEGTGQHVGKKVVGVWIKSGCNKSDDGPGYGERLLNPNDGSLVHGSNSASGCTPHVTASFEWARLVSN